MKEEKLSVVALVAIAMLAIAVVLFFTFFSADGAVLRLLEFLLAGLPGVGK